MASNVVRASPALTEVGSAARSTQRSAPYTLRIRFTKTTLNLQLTIAPESSPLWKNLPAYASPAHARVLPRIFADASPFPSSYSSALPLAGSSTAGEGALTVPPTLLHSERPRRQGLAGELGGRAVLMVSPTIVGYHNSKTRLPEATRETCFTFFRQFNELVRRAAQGQEMPVTTKRPTPKGLLGRDGQSRDATKWDPTPSMRPTKPFVPPMPTEIEIVLNGWRQNFDATLRQSLDSPQAFELRRRVTQVRDETPIPVSAPRPRRRRII